MPNLRKRKCQKSKAAELQLAGKKKRNKKTTIVFLCGNDEPSWNRRTLSSQCSMSLPNAPTVPLYEVEKIIGKRFNAELKTFEYWVKWKDYPESENSWEGAQNLTKCAESVEAFEEVARRGMFRDAIAVAAGDSPPEPAVPAFSSAAGGSSEMANMSRVADENETWIDLTADEDKAAETNKAESDASSSCSGDEAPVQETGPVTNSPDDEAMAKIDELAKVMALSPGAVEEIKAVFHGLKLHVPMDKVETAVEACIHILCSSIQLTQIMTTMNFDERLALQKQVSLINKCIKTGQKKRLWAPH